MGTAVILRSFVRRIDPSDAGAHNNLGVLYFRKGLVDEAIDAFARALALDERMGIARRNLEIAYERSGMANRKQEDLADRLRSNPEDVEALVQSGIAAKSGGRLEQAQNYFERAIGVDPRSSVLQFFLAEALYNRGMNDAALKAVKSSLELNEANPDAHYLLAFILGDLGRTEEARAATRRAISLNPTLNRAQANLALESGAVHRDVSSASEGRAGRNSGTHLALGTALFQKSYYDDALREFDRALAAGEDEGEVLRSIASVQIERGDTGGAISTLERARAGQPDDAGIAQDCGLALQLAGRQEDARGEYERAISLDPELAPPHNNLGVLLWHLDDHTASINEFRRALKCDAQLKSGRLNLALALYHEGHLQLALDAYRNILASDATDAVAWNGVGLVLTQLEKYPEARNAFARAIEARPEYAEAHYNLGFALSSLGDFDSALAETQRALELDPYYSPQTLSLAVTLPIDADVVAKTTPAIGRRDAAGSVTQFEYDPSVVESLFSVAPAQSSSSGERDDEYGLATDYLSKGLFGRAVAEVTRARARGGDPRRAWMLMGRAFLAQGLYGEALERFESALASDPSSTEAAAGAVRALLGSSRPAQAVPYLDVVLAADGSPDSLALAARVRSALGEHEEALALIRRATSEDGERSDLVFTQGEIESGAGDVVAAEASFRRAVDLDGGNAPYRIALASVLAGAGSHADAERELIAALEAEPANEPARHDLACVLMAAGRPGDALQSAIELLRRNVYHLAALITLGKILLDLDRSADAAIAFERVLRFDPANADASALLARLSPGAP